MASIIKKIKNDGLGINVPISKTHTTQNISKSQKQNYFFPLCHEIPSNIEDMSRRRHVFYITGAFSCLDKIFAYNWMTSAAFAQVSRAFGNSLAR